MPRVQPIHGHREDGLKTYLVSPDDVTIDESLEDDHIQRIQKMRRGDEDIMKHIRTTLFLDIRATGVDTLVHTLGSQEMAFVAVNGKGQKVYLQYLRRTNVRKIKDGHHSVGLKSEKRNPLTDFQINIPLSTDMKLEWRSKYLDIKHWLKYCEAAGIPGPEPGIFECYTRFLVRFWAFLFPGAAATKDRGRKGEKDSSRVSKTAQQLSGNHVDATAPVDAKVVNEWSVKATTQLWDKFNKNPRGFNLESTYDVLWDGWLHTHHPEHTGEHQCFGREMLEEAQILAIDKLITIEATRPYAKWLGRQARGTKGKYSVTFVPSRDQLDLAAAASAKAKKRPSEDEPSVRRAKKKAKRSMEVTSDFLLANANNFRSVSPLPESAVAYIQDRMAKAEADNGDAVAADKTAATKEDVAVDAVAADKGGVAEGSIAEYASRSLKMSKEDEAKLIEECMLTAEERAYFGLD